MTYALTYDELLALKPCAPELETVIAKLGGADKWNGHKIDAAQAVAAGVTLENLIWVASAIAQKDKSAERKLRMWMADCAARVLHIFERNAPTDFSPRHAIEAARDYANGKITSAARSAAESAAWSAAWSATESAARSAAWSAAWFATESAAWSAAWSAAESAASAAAESAAESAEQKWQLERLTLWFSAQEPEPWPMPAIKSAEVA